MKPPKNYRKIRWGERSCSNCAYVREVESFGQWNADIYYCKRDPMRYGDPGEWGAFMNVAYVCDGHRREDE